MRRQTISRLIVSFSICLFTVLSVRSERLPIKIYTSADGLGSSFVDNLIRDSRGFMWFCTRDGLSRFDGANFVTYQIGDKASPPGIETIYEDRNGIYWITTTGGLYRFDPNAPGSQRVAEGGRPILNAEYVDNWHGHFCEDRHGNLWFGANGLYRVTQKDGKVDFDKIDLKLPVGGNQEYEVEALSEAEDGSLWVVSSFGLIRCLPDERKV